MVNSILDQSNNVRKQTTVFGSGLRIGRAVDCHVDLGLEVSSSGGGSFLYD
jgi:hypothetical protein